MAERLFRPTDDELDRALIDLSQQVAYPQTPDLARRVGARLRASASSTAPVARPDGERVTRDGFLRRWFRWPEAIGIRPLAVAAVIVALLVGSLLALVPAARTAIADRLGLRGIAIFYLPSGSSATPLPTSTPSTPGVPVGASLHLGERITLAQAQARVAFHVLVPSLSNVGAPDEVYLSEPPLGGEVSFVYRARPGLPRTAETGVGMLLSEFRGDLAPNMIAAKGLGPRTRLEAIDVNGGQGFWIEGESHYFFYHDAKGDLRAEEGRLAGNTLLWQQGNLTLRLESALSRDEALRIARSMR